MVEANPDMPNALNKVLAELSPVRSLRHTELHGATGRRKHCGVGDAVQCQAQLAAVQLIQIKQQERQRMLVTLRTMNFLFELFFPKPTV